MKKSIGDVVMTSGDDEDIVSQGLLMSTWRPLSFKTSPDLETLGDSSYLPSSKIPPLAGSSWGRWAVDSWIPLRVKRNNFLRKKKKVKS